MAPISEEFLDKTISFWQPHYKEKLTREDARQMIENVYNAWSLLADWDLQEKEKMKT